MGVYCYTLRKPTKIVDGITIGQYAFAYKNHFWEKTTRQEALAHFHAENALDHHERNALRNVVMGDWENAESREGLTVYQVSGLQSSFLDGGPIPEVIREIGTLRKQGRRFVVEWK